MDFLCSFLFYYYEMGPQHHQTNKAVLLLVEEAETKAGLRGPADLVSHGWPLFFQQSLDQRLMLFSSLLFPQQRSGPVGDPSTLPGSHHSLKPPVRTVRLQTPVLFPPPSYPHTRTRFQWKGTVSPRSSPGRQD